MKPGALSGNPVKAAVVAEVHLFVADQAQWPDLGGPMLHRFADGRQNAPASHHQAAGLPNVDANHPRLCRVSCQNSIGHQGFNGINGHGHASRDELAANVGHHGVVFNANADVVKRFGHIRLWTDVKAGFNG